MKSDQAEVAPDKRPLQNQHMSTKTSPSWSPAQQMDETIRLSAEMNLLNARRAKARVDREARFYARYPLFARYGWLLPSIAVAAAMGAGAALLGVLVGLAKFTAG